MSMQIGQAKLSRALKDLEAAWKHIRPGWRDEAARRFERELLSPLEQKVRSAGSAMDQLGEALERARRDCE